MARVERLKPGLEQRALFGRGQAVGSQDRELVAAVLLAQTPNEVLAIVVLPQSRSGEQGEHKGEEVKHH